MEAPHQVVTKTLVLVHQIRDGNGMEEKKKVAIFIIGFRLV